MQAYYITYKVKNDDRVRNIGIDARDIKSAKRKIGKKHGYKDGRMIQIAGVSVIGYY